MKKWSFIEQYFEIVVNQAHLDRITDFLSEDYYNEDDPSGELGWKRTYFYYKELLKMFPDMQVHLEHLHSEGGRHVFLAHWQATGYEEKYLLTMGVNEQGKIDYRSSQYLSEHSLARFRK